MSAKNVDKHNRFRSITVGFRVSPEEQEELNRAVALSGLPKQEYCYRRCLNQDVVVQGNPRVYKALKQELAAALALLPEQAQEEIFRYYFLRQPQRVIGVHIDRTRSTAGRHILICRTP